MSRWSQVLLLTTKLKKILISIKSQRSIWSLMVIAMSIRWPTSYCEINIQGKDLAWVWICIPLIFAWTKQGCQSRSNSRWWTDCESDGFSGLFLGAQHLIQKKFDWQIFHHSIIHYYEIYWFLVRAQIQDREANSRYEIPMWKFSPSNATGDPSDDEGYCLYGECLLG